LIPGGRVSVFQFEYADLGAILNRFNKKSPEQEWLKSLVEDLFKDIESVNPESVVFNWECCSSCSNQTFPSDVVMDLMKVVLDKKTHDHGIRFCLEGSD